MGTLGFYEHPCGTISTIAHIIQCVSAIVILGITGWAARETKTLTVIFSLVLAALTPVVYAVTLSTSCASHRRRWHIVPLLVTDAAISYLWLTSFIFLAQDFNQVSCSVHLWNGQATCGRKYAAEAFSFIAFFTAVAALGFEILYLYLPKDEITVEEKRNVAAVLEHNLQSAGVMRRSTDMQ